MFHMKHPDMKDMPKLQSPFVRKMKGDRYLVIDEINPGFEWVFSDPDVLMVEKLDGTNVSIYMDDCELIGLQNRKNIHSISPLANHQYIQGIRNAAEKKIVPFDDGQHFGELMGPKINKNFLNLQQPVWYPFSYLQNKYHYKFWKDIERDFDSISDMMKTLWSLLYRRIHGEKASPEGVIFVQPSTGKMAKLRRDMYDWYYEHKENEHAA